MRGREDMVNMTPSGRAPLVVTTTLLYPSLPPLFQLRCVRVCRVGNWHHLLYKYEEKQREREPRVETEFPSSIIPLTPFTLPCPSLPAPTHATFSPFPYQTETLLQRCLACYLRRSSEWIWIEVIQLFHGRVVKLCGGGDKRRNKKGKGMPGGKTASFPVSDWPFYIYFVTIQP